MILPKIVKSYNQNNHIILLVENANFRLTFQSYNKVMLSVGYNGVILNEDLSDYTKTTRKYLYEAMDDIANSYELAGYTNISNVEVLNDILQGEKSKNILQHMARQTAYIDNVNNHDVVLVYKD